MKNIALNILLVIFSLIFTLVAAELVLRQTDYAHIPLKGGYYYPTEYFVSEKYGYEISKNVTGKMHDLPDYRYQITSNSLGCYDYERPVPDDYGLIIGDSMTWGYTPLEYKWTTKLEELSGQFLLKCGVTGYGTIQELEKAKKVAKAVGKNPKYLIVLYTGNDFNDDFLFPQRTTYDGILVSSITHFNLDTGEIKRRSPDELAAMYKRDYSDPLANKIREFKSSLVLYRIYKKTADVTSEWVSNQLQQDKNPTTKQYTSKLMPRGLANVDIYEPNLLHHLDEYDRTWYNKSVKAHAASLSAVVDYAKAIHAKLLFIDMTAGSDMNEGYLQHKRFADFTRKFDNSRMFYYSLINTFPVWPNNGHWNIEGNQQAGETIYNHTTKIHFFEK